MPSPKTAKLIPKKEAALESTDPDRLIELARQSNELAKVVAKNSSAPPALLSELGPSTDATIRKAVTTNPNTPSDVLLKLGSQFPEQLIDNPVFDLLFLENPNLLEDISKSALKSLIKRDVVPVSFLQWAANQDDEGILLALTINEQTPKSVLDKLANHSSESVKEAAKLHINWRVELELNWQEMVYEAIPNSSLKRNEEKEGTLASILPIQALGYLGLSTLREVAENPNTPIDVKVKILVKLAGDEDSWVRACVATNPHTLVDVLVELVGDEDRDVRSAATANPNMTTRVILEICTKGSTPNFARMLAFFHPKCPTVSLVTNFRSLAWEERYAIAQNPKTPDRTLNRLAKDGNRWVRAAANQNLAKLIAAPVT